MRYTDQKEFLYDPDVFKRHDTQVALRIHAEYVRKHGPNPKAKFFEIDRDPSEYDTLWHAPVTLRDRFTTRSPIEIPCINTFEKPNWRLTQMGIVPQKKEKFLLSNLILQEFDYFPLRGDLVYFRGYRMMIVNAVPPPEAYWQQTGVWLGIECECITVPEGDASPILDKSVVAPAEQGQGYPQVYPTNL